MSVLSNTMVGRGSSGGATGVERSVRLRASASAYFSRTFGAAGDRTLMGISIWCKRGTLGVRQELFSCGTGALTGGYATIFFDASDKLNFISAAPPTPTNEAVWVSSAVFRDPTEWLHIFLALDTANATPGYRILMYVNNVLQGYSSATFPTQGLQLQFNRAIAHEVGRFAGNPSSYFDGEITEVYFIDGQALTPSSFGQTDSNGIWVPKAYTGTYGNNGFYLNFRDASSTTALGFSYSGNENYCLSSEDLRTSAEGNATNEWGGVGTTIAADATTAPDSTNTADKIIEDTSTGGHYRSFSYAPRTTGGVVTHSVYLKAATRNIAQLHIQNAADGAYVSVNLSTGLITSSGTFGTGASFLGASLTSLGNGWYRASVTGMITGVTAYQCSIMVSNGVSYSYTGDGTSGLYAWGAQASHGTLLGDYTKTTGTAKTCDWTPNNISVTAGVTYDSMYDYPVNAASGTQPVGNYATLNPLATGAITAATGMTAGNLSYTSGSGEAFANFPFPTTGKWMWEVRSKGTRLHQGIGLSSLSLVSSATYAGHSRSGAYWINIQNGSIPQYSSNGGALTNVGSAQTLAAGDVVTFYYDADALKLWAAVRGTQIQGDPVAGTSPIMTLASGEYKTIGANPAGAGVDDFNINYGQQPIVYPLTGFKALCTANIPSDAVVTSGSFTGNASADGPVVYLKGNPTALTINGNAVTFGTHADKLATGFKLRTNSASYNASGSNTFTATAGDKFANNNRAQSNP